MQYLTKLIVDTLQMSTALTSAAGQSTEHKVGFSPIIEDFFLVEVVYSQKRVENQLTLTSNYSESDKEGEKDQIKDDKLEIMLGPGRTSGPYWRGAAEIGWETNKLDGGFEAGAKITQGLKYKGVDDLELGVSFASEGPGEHINRNLLLALS